LGIRSEGPYRFLKLADGTEISCNVLLLAMGVQWRTLDVPGIERLQGAGVYYGGGTSEAMACKGETVYMIGGANFRRAGRDALFEVAEKVVMLVRGASARQYHVALPDRTDRKDIKHEVWTRTVVTEVFRRIPANRDREPTRARLRRR